MLADGRHGVAGLEHERFSFFFDFHTVEFGRNRLPQFLAPKQQAGFHGVIILSSPLIHGYVILGEGGNRGRIKALSLQPLVQRCPAGKNLVLFQGEHVVPLVLQGMFQVEQAHFLIIHNHFGVVFDRLEPFPAFFANHAPGFINQPGTRQFGFDLGFGRPVEHRGDRAEA